METMHRELEVKADLDFPMLEKLFTEYPKYESATTDESSYVSKMKKELSDTIKKCEIAVLRHGQRKNRRYAQKGHRVDDGKPKLINSVGAEIYALSSEGWDFIVRHAHQSTIWLPNPGTKHNERDDYYARLLCVKKDRQIWWIERTVRKTTNEKGVNMGPHLFIINYNHFPDWVSNDLNYWLEIINTTSCHKP